MMPLDGDSQHGTGQDAFPDRPNHHDFWKLSRLVIQNDARADAGQPVQNIVGREIDWPSVLYMARQRAARVAQGHSEEVYGIALAAFIDGILLGVRYGRDDG